MKRPEDLADVCGVWICGKSGSGKSFEARRRAGNDVYMKRINKWWDGWDGQKTVIVDDLDTTHSFLAHDLKIWADRYAYMGEVKGGSCWMRPTQIIVTSQYRIEEVWRDEETIDALLRRFTVVLWTVESRVENN